MQTISSLVLVLAASMPLVQAAPKMETRQSETGANVDGGDAACPFEAPFRVTTNESSWWSKICIAYNTDPVSLSSEPPGAA